MAKLSLRLAVVSQRLSRGLRGVLFSVRFALVDCALFESVAIFWGPWGLHWIAALVSHRASYSVCDVCCSRGHQACYRCPSACDAAAVVVARPSLGPAAVLRLFFANSVLGLRRFVVFVGSVGLHGAL